MTMGKEHTVVFVVLVVLDALVVLVVFCLISRRGL